MQLNVVSNVFRCSRKTKEKQLWIVKNRTADVNFEETSFIVCTLLNSGKGITENTSYQCECE